MSNWPRVGAITLALCIFAFVPQRAVYAQSYPVKPIRMVLAVSGGGETVARLVAQDLGVSLGQPVVVDTQSGAGGAVGATMVARAAPDGYTILYASPNSQVFRLFLVKNVGYDPVKDFTPIAKNVETTLCIVANTSFPAGNLREFIDYARANPGKVSYSTTGIGTGHHLNSENLKSLTGIDFVHVPYKSGPQQVQDLIAGRAPVAGSILSNMIPLVRAGKIRVLAIIGRDRSPLVPDVPTVREVVPGFDSLEGWSAFFGPAGLPRPIVTRLHGEIAKISAKAEFRAAVEPLGYGVSGSTPEELEAIVKRDIASAGKLAARAGIQPE